MTETEPFLGMAVLLFVAWTFAHHVARRDLRITTYLPHVGIALVFLAYVYAGAGFAWRYVADFWPLFVLVGVQYVRRLPRSADGVLGWPLAPVMLLGAMGCYHHSTEPWKPIVKTLEESEVPHMWDDFSNWRWATDKPMPSTIKCGEVPEWPWRNGRGWNAGCLVDTYSDVFVGVPQKDDDRYVFRFKTEAIYAPMLRVYVNGRIYTAYPVGGGIYAADVKLHYRSMHSPIVLTTIEWTRAITPPANGKLLEVQIS
jgi:hypothetical protein